MVLIQFEVDNRAGPVICPVSSRSTEASLICDGPRPVQTSNFRVVDNPLTGSVVIIMAFLDIIFLTLLLRFARHAGVTSLDQIHLRISCPPFILREIPKQM